MGGYERAFAFPGFVPAYIRPLFAEGKGPFRWVALSGDPEDIAKTDRAVMDLFPEDAALRRGLGHKERHLAGLRFNEMVASGELSAPIGSAAITSIPGRWRRRIARPRRWPTARTLSPTGRC